MSRSHRVWSHVNADNYTTAKSFGGEFRQAIAVGSSASYSNDFAAIEVRETPLHGDWSIFRLFVDGECVKRAVFNNKSKLYGPVDLNTPADAAIEALTAAQS
jgi:hypothetical protein